MDSTDPPRSARRSAGEWLFQLTTITIGVLIALSFDALLKWNADRTLLNEARATIALEIADNKRELDAHLAAFDARVGRVDNGLKLVGELDAGVEPTIHQVDLKFDFPTLNNSGWQTAERTGAIALMEYTEVQRLARIYALQSLFSDTLQPMFVTTNEAGALMNAPGEPFENQATRDAMRARLIQLRAYLALGQQLGTQLSDGYSKLEQ